MFARLIINGEMQETLDGHCWRNGDFPIGGDCVSNGIIPSTGVCHHNGFLLSPDP